MILDGLPEVSHILIENEKIHRKLRKVQQRRDHYAKLYYKTLAQLDETKWELSRANSKIKEYHEKCECLNFDFDISFVFATNCVQPVTALLNIQDDTVLHPCMQVDLWVQYLAHIAIIQSLYI